MLHMSGSVSSACRSYRPMAVAVALICGAQPLLENERTRKQHGLQSHSGRDLLKMGEESNAKQLQSSRARNTNGIIARINSALTNSCHTLHSMHCTNTLMLHDRSHPPSSSITQTICRNPGIILMLRLWRITKALSRCQSEHYV
jgi:hypothetical protein